MIETQWQESFESSESQVGVLEEKWVRSANFADRFGLWSRMESNVRHFSWVSIQVGSHGSSYVLVNQRPFTSQQKICLVTRASSNIRQAKENVAGSPKLPQAQFKQKICWMTRASSKIRQAKENAAGSPKLTHP